MMDNNLSTTVIFGEALVDDFNNEQIVGGAPFNVARHLSAFMAPCLAITRIGDDRSGQLVRANEFAGAICAIPGAVPRDMGFYDKWMTRWR
jgi:hypothetical protein